MELTPSFHDSQNWTDSLNSYLANLQKLDSRVDDLKWLLIMSYEQRNSSNFFLKLSGAIDDLDDRFKFWTGIYTGTFEIQRLATLSKCQCKYS